MPREFQGVSNRMCLMCFGLLGLMFGLVGGCARWLPKVTEEVPVGVAPRRVELSSDTVGVETILLRLTALDAQGLPELWGASDEQFLSAGLRMELDRNGLRVGVFHGMLPGVVQRWIGENAERIQSDPLEQAGVVADVSSFTQIFRCRASQRKELTIRNLQRDSVTLLYNDGGVKGGRYDRPHFLMSLQATPNGDGSARLQLIPEMEYGQAKRVVVAKDSAIRTDERRERVVWKEMGLDLQLQLGDCLLMGATMPAHGLGEHFFRTLTRGSEIEDVILLVRISELHPPDEFVRNMQERKP